MSKSVVLKFFNNGKQPNLPIDIDPGWEKWDPAVLEEMVNKLSKLDAQIAGIDTIITDAVETKTSTLDTQISSVIDSKLAAINTQIAETVDRKTESLITRLDTLDLKVTEVDEKATDIGRRIP